jgi:hypothetical protein
MEPEPEPTCDCPEHDHATYVCDAALNCVLNSCRNDYSDCDGDPNNGCEVGIYNNLDHCGACGNSCSGMPVAEGQMAVCNGYACGVQCEEGKIDEDGDVANGCEASEYVTADTQNCPKTLPKNGSDCYRNKDCFGDYTQESSGCSTSIYCDIDNRSFSGSTDYLWVVDDVKCPTP